MKKVIYTAFLAFLFITSYGQEPKPITVKNKVVDASCGTCQFKLKGKECELAVKINNVAYFVDGTKIDDHGDAHGKHGFCNAVRKAQVSGTVTNGRFNAIAFKLLPEPKTKKDNNKTS